jgi:anaerobic selenocysteine-containing dehydrogenase
VKNSSSIVEFAFGPSALRSVARVSLVVRPGEAHLVAKAIAGGGLPQGLAFSEEELDETRRLIGESGEGVVFVVGRPNLGEDARVLETAIRTLSERYPDAKFLPALRRSNVMGALDMGLGPNLRPGRGFDGSVEGRDTLGQLDALRKGDQKAVLLLGGCLLGNVVDPAGAEQALDAADVVVVTGHGGATLAYANVVLPAAIQHERSGTVTNIEGRVSAVSPKIVPPGSAWPDVAIAAELAEEFGQSLGLSSVEQTSQTIEETTGYPALSVLNDEVYDGVVVGRNVTPSLRHSLDPMAFPGIRSADTVGLGARTGSTVVTSATGSVNTSGATWSDVHAGNGLEVPLADSYAFRVVLSRRLYDRGVAMQGSPALHGLIPTTSLSLNHFDLDRLGLAHGDVVKVSGAKGSVDLPVALDDGVARGTTEIVFGTLDASGENVVRELVDGSNVITQLRLETR